MTKNNKKPLEPFGTAAGGIKQPRKRGETSKPSDPIITQGETSVNRDKKIIGTCTLDEAFERFASMSEENRKVLEESKKLYEEEKARRRKGVKRYVKSKDGSLFEVLRSDGENVFVKDYDYDNNDWYTKNIKLCDVRQADTIEELCDKFVLIDLKENHTYVSDDLGSLPCIYCYDKKHTVVYGSTWINGNLIKAAQMNEKGDLELL